MYIRICKYILSIKYRGTFMRVCKFNERDLSKKDKLRINYITHKTLFKKHSYKGGFVRK